MIMRAGKKTANHQKALRRKDSILNTQNLVAVVLALSIATSSQSARAVVESTGSSAPGTGFFMTAPELEDHCGGRLGQRQSDTFATGACLGYITGVAEGLLLWKEVCYHNVPRGELSDVVMKYMKDHQDEVRQYVAFVLVGKALKAVYPVTAACEALVN